MNTDTDTTKKGSAEPESAQNYTSILAWCPACNQQTEHLRDQKGIACKACGDSAEIGGLAMSRRLAKISETDAPASNGAQPTPGPWEAVAEGHNVAGHIIWTILGPESAVAKVYTYGEDDNPGRTESTARFIADSCNNIERITAERDQLLAACKALDVAIDPRVLNASNGKSIHARWEALAPQ
jgi:hypothetical protein